MGAETLALVILAGTVFAELVRGSASTTSRAITEGVCLLLLAVGTGLLAFFLLRRRSLAKTPTLLWNAMLIPVGVNLVGGGAPGYGYAVVAVAAVTFLAALSLPRYDLDETDEPGEPSA